MNSHEQSLSKAENIILPIPSNGASPFSRTSVISRICSSFTKIATFRSTSRHSPTTVTSAKRVARDNTVLGKQLQQIDGLHSELIGEVNKMNNRIKDAMNECQDDLLLAYKLEMQKVEKDYQEINEKINSDREGAKIEQKILGVKQELHWFKTEAVRLYKKYEEQKAVLTKMKAALEVVEEDRDFYQQQLAKNRKINKSTAMQIKAFRKKFPQLHLMDVEQEKEKDLFGEAENEESLEAILKEQLDEPEEAQSITEKKEELKDQLQVIQPDKLAQLKNENNLLKNHEKHSVSTINRLKKELDQVKKEAREIRAQKAAENLERTDLKEFFLNCIEEVRKDIIRKKSVGTGYLSGRPITEQNKMKRVTSVGAKLGSPKPFSDVEKPFGLTDKKKVVEMMLSNESVLTYLYESMFPPEKPRRIATGSKDRLAMTTGNWKHFA